ncbi:multi-component transcriptional regulator, winged helix family [Stanieria cyanosphaera PCC 7437]|uniref:Multi-component transcriptional regulator, winged helix family n=1 Tax=Stanieria cyanosphaera (strain ATCC 29371 / PCC 7437) TaxID=111780 RepID=K9XS16_STAC7|nr:response regulator [Stanieria cyanosphaera]AFZ34851.1 multi-component transcriptional regulator, winged helix family [Stanieria cyanosphaera PCC 7437]
MKILLIEDDESLANLVQETLTKQQHYLVDCATDGLEGLELAENFGYDLILLDLVLPKLDGIQLCQKLRSQGDRTPILLLTAQDALTKKVKGLDAGADDYLVKPFELDELLARIRALLRRGNDTLLPILHWQGLNLDPNSCQVNYCDQPLKLTAKEYALLELFLRHPQRIFSQSSLLDQIWSFDEFPSENAVRTQIKGLRQKLKQVGASADFIETIYGMGYRLKQSATAFTEPTKSKIVKPKQSATKLPDLNNIWLQHRAKYLAHLETLTQAIQFLKNELNAKNSLAEAIQIAHTLAGSLGTFGLKKASKYAGQIEQKLKNYSQLTVDDFNLLEQLIEKLNRELNQSFKTSDNLLFLTPRPRTTTYRHKLLIIDDDSALTQVLMSEANTWGLETTVANNLEQARKIVNQNIPDIVLLDLFFPEAIEGGFELLEELTTKQPPIPTIVFTAKESLTTRVKVARLGGKLFLQKPISSYQVLEAIAQVLEQFYPSVAKILVVDEQQKTLDELRQLLAPWGFQVILLADSRQFWQIIEQSLPDLVILQLELPEISGIELCQVVRNDPNWHQLPILAISQSQDEQMIQQAFAAGIDDYLCLPLNPQQLITRIFNRLDKERYRRQQSEIDTLTGVLNRKAFILQINRLLNLAKRQDKPLCFIVIDLDNFKHINDCYGHDAGDLVLRYLGKLLNQLFRKEDVVARWGGEEFVLGLYDVSQESGNHKLEHLLATFCQHNFTDSRDRKFQVSFSGGLAEYPRDGQHLETLYQVADRRLYQAKAQGKNLIV